tara:strand:+ start:440 stop:643 length:204 start_codon:yes stop_codon:yes gene_type:complete
MIGVANNKGGLMKVGDLVKYKTTNDYGIILDKEYTCYNEDTYMIYWFSDCDCDWWDGSDLEVISESG